MDLEALGDWADEPPLALAIDREATFGALRLRPALLSNSGARCRVAWGAAREPPQEVSLSTTHFHFAAVLLSVRDAPVGQPSTGGEEQRWGNEMAGLWDFDQRIPPGTAFELAIEFLDSGTELHRTIEIIRCMAAT